MNDTSIGKKAAILTMEEVRKECEKENVGCGFVIRNLKRLSRLRVPKPFIHNGEVVYSKNLPDGSTQVNATKVLYEMQGMKPAEKHEIDGDLTIEIVNYGSSDKKTNE